MSATCVGCDVDSDDMTEYDPINSPVEEDGTYADGQFVCTDCYVILIHAGSDVGTPQEIQKAAIEVVRPVNNLT